MLKWELIKLIVKTHYQAMHHVFVASSLATKMAHEMMPGCMVGTMYAMSGLYPLTCKPEDMMAHMNTRRLSYFYADTYGNWRISILCTSII